MTTRMLIALTFVALLASACGDLLEPAAAVVGGEKIPESEVEAALEDFEAIDCKQIEAQGIDPQSAARQFQQAFLAQAIRRTVLENEAEERDVGVTESDVDERIETIQADFEDEKAFRSALAEQCITEEQLRNVVYTQAVEEELKSEVTADLQPTDDELRAFYQANRNNFTERRVSHIVVDARADAQRLAARLDKAPTRGVEERFASLARKNSLDTLTREEGGDLGYVSPNSNVDPRLLAAVGELDVGEVSEPVQTASGYEVIMVTDERTLSFEQVRGEIEGRLAGREIDRAWQRWLQDAYREADIEVNPAYGRLDIENGQVIVNESPDDVPATDVTPSPSPESNGP